jgi:hypothetical protein
MTWAVALGADVLLLDVLGGLRTVWRVPDAGPSPRGFTRRPGLLGFVTGRQGGEVEGWRYEGAQLVLRGRGNLTGDGPFALRQDGRWVTLPWSGEGMVLFGEASTNPQRVPLELLSGEPLGLASGGGVMVAAGVRTPAGVTVLALDLEGRPLATLELLGAHGAALRLEGDRLTVADDLGRVVAADLAAGRVTHDLRS